MTTATIISSQRYIDSLIVESKRAAADYTVLVSPAFCVGGRLYRVLVDGHHSYRAAIMDGAEVEMIECTMAEDDSTGLIESDIDTYLEIKRLHGDSDFYDVSTGRDVW